MVGGIIISVLLLVLGWVFFAPLTLYLQSEKGIAYVQWYGMAMMEMKWEDEKGLIFLFWIFGYRKEFRPKLGFWSWKKKKIKKTKKSKNQKEKSWPFRRIQHIAWAMVRTCRVRIFRLTLDTGDVIRNAQLVPLFAHLNFWMGSNMNVNYTGKTELEIKIQNRLIDLAVAFLRAYFK